MDTAAETVPDLDKLQRLAASYGEAIGTYATAVLDTPLPWTKMHQVGARLCRSNRPCLER